MSPGGCAERALLVAALAAGVLACSPSTAQKTAINPVRDALEASVRALPAAEPLRLRYNPAACNCPVFELRVGDRWRRASWTNADTDAWAPTMKSLASSDPERWPIHMLVRATVDPDIVRTAQGDYALRFEVSELLSKPLAADATRSGPPAAAPAAASPTGS